MRRTLIDFAWLIVSLMIAGAVFGQDLSADIVTLERVYQTAEQASSGSSIPPAVVQSYSSVGKVQKSHGNGVAQSGSATYIGDGLWLTNAHVVLSKQKGTFTVTTKRGYVLPGKVVHVEYDQEPDLALIETANQDHELKPVPLSDAGPAIGDLVYPSGFDQGRLEWHTIWPARVTKVYSGDIESVGLGRRRGSISGNSGGPTFNSAGELIAPLNANGGTHYVNGRGPTDGLGTTITVCWRSTRVFLLPWRRRVMRSLAQCGPQGFCNPQGMRPLPPSYPPAQPSVPRPTLPDPISSNPSQPPSFKPTLPSTPDDIAAGIDYDKLADLLVDRLAKDERLKGPKGDKGDRGEAGTVSQDQLLAMSSALMQQMKLDPAFRGPAGPPGKAASVDVAALTDKIKSELNRRFIVVNSDSGNVIDDEMYAFDEPVILDITRLRGAAAGNE